MPQKLHKFTISLWADDKATDEEMLDKLNRVFKLAKIKSPIESVEGIGRKKTVKVPKEYSAEFLAFWEKYHKSRRSSKKGAFTAWIKSGIEQSELLRLCLSALEWQSHTEAWADNDGKYFPLASTYLNGARWEDENPNVGQKIEKYYDMDGIERERYVDEGED